VTFAPPFQFNSRFHPFPPSRPASALLSSAHAHRAVAASATVGVRSASPSGPTDRRRRCFLPPTPRRAHHAPAMAYASETKKGALPKHPVTDLARAHTHHRCSSQMQIKPSLSLRCGKNRGLPFLAHGIVREVALDQCACDGHHGGH
jgi:hypothetical protein